MADKCNSCGRLTYEGERKWRENLKPIYGTDLSKPVEELLKEIRNKITNLRGQLHDIRNRWPAQDSLEDVEGLLTCGLVTLYYEIEQIEKNKKHWAEQEAEKLIVTY
jgi:hypothetical protein